MDKDGGPNELAPPPNMAGAVLCVHVRCCIGSTRVCAHTCADGHVGAGSWKRGAGLLVCGGTVCVHKCMFISSITITLI